MNSARNSQNDHRHYRQLLASTPLASRREVVYNTLRTIISRERQSGFPLFIEMMRYAWMSRSCPHRPLRFPPVQRNQCSLFNRFHASSIDTVFEALSSISPACFSSSANEFCTRAVLLFRPEQGELYPV